MTPGTRATFRTTGSPDGFPIEYAHDRQRCTIVRPIGPEETDLDETGPMYVVRFEDGATVDAFSDELTPEPTP